MHTETEVIHGHGQQNAAGSVALVRLNSLLLAAENVRLDNSSLLVSVIPK